MVELNQNYRAMDTIVVDALFFRAADPCEMGSIEMFPDLVHFDFGVSGIHVADVGAD